MYQNRVIFAFFGVFLKLYCEPTLNHIGEVVYEPLHYVAVRDLKCVRYRHDLHVYVGIFDGELIHAFE